MATRKNKKKAGRPLFLSNENASIIDEMLLQLMDGKSLSSICRENEGMPARTTVLKWLLRADRAMAQKNNDPSHFPYIEFRDRYIHARGRHADSLVDDALDIADDGRNDYMEVIRKKGLTIQFDKENVARSRLRVETRIKLAEKIAPTKYGPPALVHIEDNRVKQTNIFAISIKRAEQRAIGLPSESLLLPEPQKKVRAKA